jgi:hypothetical protein
MIAERSWLNTQRAFAVRVPQLSLSNVWWPLRLNDTREDVEKALVLWFASTLGILTMIAHRVPTRGGWVQFKKPTLQQMPVLNVTALTNKQISDLAASYDALAKEELCTFPYLADDPVRAQIDDAVAKTLSLPHLGVLRNELAFEPVITQRSCGRLEPEDKADEALQFELL